MNWDEIIKENNIQFRHLYDTNGKLWGTICHTRVHKETELNDLLVYGIAVVSKKDTPTKTDGRTISFCRYLHRKHEMKENITSKRWAKFMKGHPSRQIQVIFSNLSGVSTLRSMNDLMAYYYETYVSKRDY